MPGPKAGRAYCGSDGVQHLVESGIRVGRRAEGPPTSRWAASGNQFQWRSFRGSTAVGVDSVGDRPEYRDQRQDFLELEIEWSELLQQILQVHSTLIQQFTLSDRDEIVHVRYIAANHMRVIRMVAWGKK